MTDRPATEPRTEAGRRLITMMAQIDPEPQGIGWLRNAILAIEAEAAPQCPCDEYEPCAEHQSEPRTAYNRARQFYNERNLPQPYYDLLDEAVAEAAQGTAPLPDFVPEGWPIRSFEGAAPRAEGLPRVCWSCEGEHDEMKHSRGAPQAEGLDSQTMRDLKQIVGCTVANDGDYPCDHNIMVEQFLARLSRQTDD